jgi:hypothetical protein
VHGKNNTTGIGLVEAYDLDESIGITLTNVSTRSFVDTDQNVMIGGFISGDVIVRVIVRALGPTLSAFGAPNVLADPTLELRDLDGTLITSNDNWKDTQQAEIQASGKAPPNDNESAIIIVRPAANNTAIVRGKNNTGNALIDAYILPPCTGTSRSGCFQTDDRIKPAVSDRRHSPWRARTFVSVCGRTVRPLFWLRHRGILR